MHKYTAWLAITADREESVRIWDAARGRERAIPTGFIAYAMAVAPDGSWLATGDNDWTVRIWDTATGRQRASLSHHDWVHARQSHLTAAGWPLAAKMGHCGSGTQQPGVSWR
jgi:WD40 repeat protein